MRPYTSFGPGRSCCPKPPVEDEEGDDGSMGSSGGHGDMGSRGESEDCSRVGERVGGGVVSAVSMSTSTPIGTRWRDSDAALVAGCLLCPFARCRVPPLDRRLSAILDSWTCGKSRRTSAKTGRPKTVGRQQGRSGVVGQARLGAWDGWR